jgi:hypothetical protein
MLPDNFRSQVYALGQTQVTLKAVTSSVHYWTCVSQIVEHIGKAR